MRSVEESRSNIPILLIIMIIQLNQLVTIINKNKFNKIMTRTLLLPFQALTYLKVEPTSLSDRFGALPQSTVASCLPI